MAEDEAINGRRPNPAALATPVRKSCFENKLWLLAVTLVVAALIAYQPVWHAGFIWDDDDHLTANPAMTAPHGLLMIWSSLAISRYYPLTLTTFWVQRRLWGLNPLPYHLVNLALHATNGILLWFVLRRLRVPAAWLAAMVWVLHPVNVESVAWITELKNTQSGAFFFLTLLCYLRAEANEDRNWYTLALVCGMAALLSKPSTVVLPAVLLLCAWWQRRRWQPVDLHRTIPFFVMAAGISALAIIQQRTGIRLAATADWKLGPAERLVIAGKDIWFYAAKVLWPAQLTFVYPRWEVGARSVSSWMPVAGIVAGGVVLCVWRRQSWARAVLFGVAFFVVALLPVVGFLNVYYFRYSFVADHFQYLASVGLITLAVGTGANLCERTGKFGRTIGVAVAFAALLMLGALTWRQAHVYRDIETLWQDTLAKNPQCWMAHYNLGIALAKRGKLQDAMPHWEQALRINPDYAEAHNNLGVGLAQAGNLQAAIGQYEQALRINPDYADVHYNLAGALMRLGRIEEGISHYEQALRIKPDDAEARSDLVRARALQ